MRPLLLVGFALLVIARDAHAQRAQLQLEGRPHAGMPFTIAMLIDGFDETPQPDQPKLEIAGAQVTPLGAQPKVSQSIQIINGRRSDTKHVQWVLRWRVEIAKAGRVHVPPITVVQGSKRAATAAGELDVESIPNTDDMKIELTLPERPVFVGENIEIKLAWLFRTQPEDQSFSVPLMSLEDFTVSAPPVTDPRRALTMQAGTKELQLPYEVDQTTIAGSQFHRVTVRFFAAPKKSGKVAVPAASVVAALPVGRRDFFGNAPSRLYRATDVAKTLEVKPLPETDKPPGFAGAVGTQFSLAVNASRSVVQLGEPVELAITVKSNARLDTLSLGKLDGPGGLPKDKFTVPVDPPTGELADEGKTKTFKVTAQVTGPASEIPAIAFSYFDPVKGTYQTIHSDPIAVSVKGGSVVGAGDVVGVTPSKKSGAAPAETELALVGADLALSAPSAVTTKPLGGALLWLLIAALYAIPLALLGIRTWQLRTQGQRDEAAEVKAARRRVEQELARAAKDPARDAAGPLVAALRAFARVLDREPADDGLFATIETESFAPASASSPLAADLRVRVDDLVRRWTADAKRKSARVGKAGAGAAAGLAFLIAFAPTADATPTPSAATPTPSSASTMSPRSASSTEQALADGRAAYQDAMTLPDASARKAAFARAAAALAEAARTLSDRPELLTDWGNAALGAGDVATATLAYRRALAIDAGNVRARRNLNWLRSRQADALRPGGESATDTLFFFHRWPRSYRLLAGAFGFAAAVLLLVPWGGRRRRGLTGLAVLPVVVWLGMLVSLVIEDRRGDDAVVMDAVVLRAADSAGAPAALTQPLPRGAEVTLLERRDAWTRIRLPSGTTGWVPDGAVERIARH